VGSPCRAAVLVAVSFISMFGGGLRLGAEVVARLLPADFILLLTPKNIGLAVATAILVVVIQILLFRWPWYREQMRLNQEGIRALYGLPPSAPSLHLVQALRRIALWSGLLVLPSIALGIALPGPAAAACAVVVGVVLRVVAVVATAV
jgi:hypothetical protein